MNAPHVVPDDAYTVLTPYGALGAFFPDDGPVLWTGSERAKDYFAALLRAIVPPTGFGYTMESMDAQDLMGMVIPTEWGVMVREPVAMVQAAIEAIRTGEDDGAELAVVPPPDPAATPEWPQLNPVKA